MKRNKTSETGAHIREKRRALAHDRWKRRATAIAWYGLLAEVFFLPLSPSVATVALLVGIAGTALRFYVDKEFHFRHLRFDVPAVLFVAVSGLSVLSSPDRGFSFYNYYNLVGVYVLTYLLIGQNVREPGQMKSILRMACAAAVIVLLYGYYQFLFGIDISSMKWVDGDAFPELRKRVFSTWENPNILAGYLDIIICLAFGLFMKCRDRERRILLGAFMIAAAACLAMTYARGACLVIAVILAGYGVLRDRRVLVACILVVAILFVLDPMLYERITSVFTKVDTSTEMRLAFWESTVAMIQDHPFLGIGWGAYWMVYPEYDFYLQGANVLIVHAHNIYLNYMAEIGIPGAVAFFWFFFGTIIMALRTHFPADAGDAAEEMTPFGKYRAPFRWDRLWHDWKEYDILAGLSLGIGLAVLSVALNGLTDDLLFNIPSSMLLWMLAALAGALSYMCPEKVDTAENETSGNDFLKKFQVTVRKGAKDAKDAAMDAKDKVQDSVQDKVHGMLYRELPADADASDKDKAEASTAKPAPGKEAPSGDTAPAAEQPVTPRDPMDELAEEVRKALLQRKQEEEAAAKAAEEAAKPAEQAAETAEPVEATEAAPDDKPQKQEPAEQSAKPAEPQEVDPSAAKDTDEVNEAAEEKNAEKKVEKEAGSHEETKRDIKGDD
ncbi:O-antigen ligase family protein [Mitsuokella multacida]|uniref:O-antigen ligase family protein n=1 Tax=Mitsuokella multacida TaxID=52226 RepID=UPI0026DF9903|nr:O-antigen ligase family protein [Mitsuokella multacida]